MSTSPDVLGYLGLVLVDPDPRDIATTAIAGIQTTIPGLILDEGHTETALIEALAVQAAGIRYTAAGIPGLLYELVIRTFGATRDTGAAPQIQVTFTVSDTAGHTIPAGTTVRAYPTSGGDPVDFTTDTAAVVAAGATVSAAVLADAIVVTDTANGIPTGTALTVIDAIAYLDSATLTGSVTPGRLPEDPTAFLARAGQALSRLTTTIVRDQDMVTWLLEQPSVYRALAVGLYDPTNPIVPPGSALGHTTAVVAATGGGSLSDPALALLAAGLTAAGSAGLTYHVVNATVTPISVTLTVHRVAAATDAAVTASVTNALQQLLDPNAWAWAPTVTLAAITAAADRATGVDVVLSIAAPAADVMLPGLGPLPTPGTIAVTVTHG